MRKCFVVLLPLVLLLSYLGCSENKLPTGPTGQEEPVTVKYIRYYLPQDIYVRLEVFDVSGRSVALLVDGWQEGGPLVI